MGILDFFFFNQHFLVQFWVISVGGRLGIIFPPSAEGGYISLSNNKTRNYFAVGTTESR